MNKKGQMIFDSTAKNCVGYPEVPMIELMPYGRKWHPATTGIPIAKFTDYERGFIEGFLDADGSIVVGLPSRYVSCRIRVKFFNNDVLLLEKIISIMGKKKRIHSYGSDTTLRHKKLRYRPFAVVYANRDAYEILSQITLVSKEKKRQMALRILEIISQNDGRSMTKKEKEEHRKKQQELHNQFVSLKSDGLVPMFTDNKDE